ncbi:MAG: hypothetical protein PHR68_04850 [Candidatus Gracilibacteria bacterium]|nr:hypothetical protein [Candidatus Gracilibacteria bacterium]
MKGILKINNFKNIDIIKKINYKNNVKLNRNNIQYILDFVLLWNLFELKYLKECTKKNKIEEFIEKNEAKIIGIYSNEINNIFIYFKDRYNKNDDKFNNLNIKDKKEDIKNNLVTGDNKLFTVIYIISRFRNNLFHGSKRIEFIDLQKENFEKINNFLCELIFIENNKS